MKIQDPLSWSESLLRLLGLLFFSVLVSPFSLTKPSSSTMYASSSSPSAWVSWGCRQCFGWMRLGGTGTGAGDVRSPHEEPPEYVKKFFRRWALSVGYVVACVTIILGIQIYYLLK